MADQHGAPDPTQRPPVPQKTPARGSAKASRTGAYIRLGFIGLLTAFLLVFVFQNTHFVYLEFLSAKFTAPAWLMLLLVLLLGAGIGYFLGRRTRCGRR